MSTTTTSPSPTAVSPDQIFQVGFGFWASKVLLSAVELDLFTELAKRPGTVEDLRGRLRLHTRSARDFLDALVALQFLERRDGVYHNVPATDVFLDKAKPSYIGGLLEMVNNRLYPFWGHLTEALRTGQPQNEAKQGGPDFFHALYSDPARLREFLRAMSGGSRGGNMAIAAKFPWKDRRTFVDVGTAQGDLPVQIALRNPHLEGIGFDLPQVGPIFQEYVEQNGLSKRVRFMAGDFFKDPIPKADVITMGQILHDWNLDEKKMLIRKAYDSLPEGGALIVCEAIIDDDRSQNPFGLLMSLNMLVETPGGFDFTGADCIGWMNECGFREARVEYLCGPKSMVVGIK